ncbi:hypothetical protein GF373_04885 [bacterium]|nr:hypothetical protein [bacterium]
MKKRYFLLIAILVIGLSMSLFAAFDGEAPAPPPPPGEEVDDDRPPEFAHPGDGPPRDRGKPPWERDGRFRRGGPPPDKDKREWIHRMREHFRELRKENPELAETLENLRRVRMEIEKHVHLYHRTEEEKKQKELENHLAKLFEEEFNLELKHQKMEIERMEEKLLMLKNALEKKQQYKENIIEIKLKKALEEPYERGRFHRGPGEHGRKYERMRRGGWRDKDEGEKKQEDE